MTAGYTGADLFVDALERYGVEHVFGNPGTTELPVLEALGDSDLEYVLGLHEDVAVGMAAGYAQTRRYHAHHDESITPVGVVNLHITPGLAHGIGNVYAASFTSAPLVVTAGNHERDFRHEEPILHGDLERLVDQFTKWSDEVLDVAALPTMLRRAVRVALTPPTGPVFLALPADVMRSPTAPDAIEPLGPIPNAGGGDPQQIGRAADLIAAAGDPILVLGDAVARTRGGVEAAVSFAEAAGARVHGEMLACEVTFPTSHDLWVSHIPPREDVARLLVDGDVVVFVGTSTHTTLLPHEEDLLDAETTVVHIGDDLWEIGKNHPTDAAVVGDPALVMERLAEILRDRIDADERERRVERVGALQESLEPTMAAMSVDERPDGETRVGKHQLVDALSRLAGDAFVVDEGVTAKYPLLLRYDMAPEQFISNKGGGLGYGLPASVGAALAESIMDEPRDVVGYVGDGSYLYYPQAIYSAVRADLDLTVVVPDNRNYRILKDNALQLFGGEADDRNFVGMDFDPAVDLVTNAESHGARGHRVETPDELESTVQDAIQHEGVDLVDVLVYD
ncbi:MAG: thiamine pyrophosphate-binding protein [Halobacteriota archaeon]